MKNFKLFCLSVIFVVFQSCSMSIEPNFRINDNFDVEMKSGNSFISTNEEFINFDNNSNKFMVGYKYKDENNNFCYKGYIFEEFDEYYSSSFINGNILTPEKVDILCKDYTIEEYYDFVNKNITILEKGYWINNKTLTFSELSELNELLSDFYFDNIKKIISK